MYVRIAFFWLLPFHTFRERRLATASHPPFEKPYYMPRWTGCVPKLSRNALLRPPPPPPPPPPGGVDPIPNTPPPPLLNKTRGKTKKKKNFWGGGGGVAILEQACRRFVTHSHTHAALPSEPGSR